MLACLCEELGPRTAVVNWSFGPSLTLTHGPMRSSQSTHRSELRPNAGRTRTTTLSLQRVASAKNSSFLRARSILAFSALRPSCHGRERWRSGTDYWLWRASPPAGATSEAAAASDSGSDPPSCVVSGLSSLPPVKANSFLYLSDAT